jgi:hypothetical protein
MLSKKDGALRLGAPTAGEKSTALITMTAVGIETIVESVFGVHQRFLKTTLEKSEKQWITAQVAR